MAIDNDKARSIVNSTGYPLQLKVESIVNTNPKYGWTVLTKEHSWVNDEQDAEGFLDLVLEQSDTSTLLMVECKRVKDTAWIFLQDKRSPIGRASVKSWVSGRISGEVSYYGWYDGFSSPYTPESQFCVVAGQDAKSKPMLERVSADLIQATEAFAKEDFKYHGTEFLRIFVPLIITTAELKVLKYDVNHISLDSGEVSESISETVPYLRFKKQFSHRESKVKNMRHFTYNQIDREKENTVFVVNSNHVEEFLNTIRVTEK